MSIARRTLPSRLELKRPVGSVEGGALGEGQLHGFLVGLAGADDAAVLPDRDAAPFPGLFDLGGSAALMIAPDLSEGLAAPVAQLGDPRVDQLGRERCPLLLWSPALLLFFMVVVTFLVRYRSRLLNDCDDDDNYGCGSNRTYRQRQNRCSH